MSRDEYGEDRILIAKARDGDTSAYENLVRKYQHRIYALCHRMTGAHQSADDLSQETFIIAFFALSGFKEEMNFFSWIRKIAFNSTLNYLKLRKRETSLGDQAERIPNNPGSSGETSPHEHLQQAQMKARLQQAVGELPDDQRAVFVLKVHESQSYEEIAATLDIPPGTVMSRLNRARRKLRQVMADYLQGGER